MRWLLAIVCPPLFLITSPASATARLASHSRQAEEWFAGTNAAVHATRVYLEPIPVNSSINIADANQILWNATQQAIAAGVRYRLGDKNSANGAIDCSGWVAEITLKSFSAINDAATPKVIFDEHDKRILRNDSDAIITGVEAATGFALTAEQMSSDTLREGMLIGSNFSAYGWEENRRTYGIDHIVQVVRDPTSGEKMISQSSSTGNGVNLTPLKAWLRARVVDGLIPAGRVRAVDPFLLADGRSRNLKQTSL